MRLSAYFLPTLKETPAEAQIVSHRLMLRAGMIRQASAGIYSWLPLGFRVLKRIEQIVREEQDRAGCQEVLMPTIQSAELWRESGRYDDYGKEMLRITDRHEREMLYGPTNEELITDIFRSAVRSYRDLPKHALSHPVEVPRRGAAALRRDARPRVPDEGRLFLRPRLRRRAQALLQQDVRRLSAHLRAHGAEGDPDGGRDRADRRRSQPRVHHPGRDRRERGLLRPRLARARRPGRRDRLRRATSSRSSTTGPASTPRPTRSTTRRMSGAGRRARCTARGIEVGHIFYFGTNIRSRWAPVVDRPDGEQVPVEMGSYGIGVSRLVGAIIEASHDEAGIIWPESVAPFQVGLINLQGRRCRDHREVPRTSSTPSCAARGVEVLYDDRDERPGAKFAEMDLIGLPWQLIVGPRGLAAGTGRAEAPRDRRAPGARHRRRARHA